MNAPHVFAEVANMAHTFTASRTVLVIQPSGEAQITLHATFGYAIYPAPGEDLPHWGDPGFLYRGRVSSASTTKVDNLTPDEFGQVTIPISIPATLRSEDGSSRIDIAFDELIVIGFEDGEPVSVQGAPVGARCL